MRTSRLNIFMLTALIFCLIFTFLSCVSGEDSDLVEEETTVDMTGFKCTIVRGDTSSKAATDAAVKLRKQLAEAGIDAKIETDWVKRGEQMVRFENEILVGRTNRPESEEAYARVDDSETPCDYLVKIGEIPLIAATDECIAEAADIFAEAYLNFLRGELSEDTEFVREHVFPIAGLTFEGKPLNEWTIVIPEKYNDYALNEIKGISDLFHTLSGKRPEITDTPSSGNNLFIGSSSDMVPSEYDLSYIVKKDGSSIYIGGSNCWADLRAIYNELIYSGMGLKVDGSILDAKSDIRLSECEVGDENHYRSFAVSAWCTSGDSFDTERQVKEAAEAGFTKVNVAAANNVSSLDMMKWCAIYDLQILWSGFANNGEFDASSYSSISKYFDAPHVWGFYLRDEPNSSLFPVLKSSVEAFAECSDKVAFINIFPMYASREQLGNPTYHEHVVQFLDTVKPKWTSVDIYPLNVNGLYDGYCKNLDEFATPCRERGIPFSVYLQSVSFAASKRTPSRRDLEWQVWCIKSFGADEAIYFTYMTPYSSAEDFKDALIDHNLEKTNRWFYAQAVNFEFAVYDEAFSRYKNNLGAFSVNSDGSTKFLKFNNQYDASGFIKEIETEYPLLIGCFEGDNGSNAFTVVNCNDLQQDEKAELKINVGASLTVWQNGVASILNPNSEGFITLTLDNGEGVFCEISAE